MQPHRVFLFWTQQAKKSFSNQLNLTYRFRFACQGNEKEGVRSQNLKTQGFLYIESLDYVFLSVQVMLVTKLLSKLWGDQNRSMTQRRRPE